MRGAAAEQSKQQSPGGAQGRRQQRVERRHQQISRAKGQQAAGPGASQVLTNLGRVQNEEPSTVYLRLRSRRYSVQSFAITPLHILVLLVTAILYYRIITTIEVSKQDSRTRELQIETSAGQGGGGGAAVLVVCCSYCRLFQ